MNCIGRGGGGGRPEEGSSWREKTTYYSERKALSGAERQQMRRQGTKQKKTREFPAGEGSVRQEKMSGCRVGKKTGVWFTSPPMKCTRCSAVRCYEPVCSDGVLLPLRKTVDASQVFCCLSFFIILSSLCFRHLSIFSSLLPCCPPFLLFSSLLHCLQNLREGSLHNLLDFRL